MESDQRGEDFDYFVCGPTAMMDLAERHLIACGVPLRNIHSERFQILAIHIAALYLPWTQFVLRVEPIEMEAWSRIIAVASTILVAMELHKFFRRRVPLGERRR